MNFCILLNILSLVNIVLARINEKIVIHDDTLSESSIKELYRFVSEMLAWQRRSIFSSDNEDNMFWHSTSYQDAFFSKLEVWKSLRELVMSQFDGDALGHVWPLGVKAFVVHRGDFQQIQRSNSFSLATLFIFICKNWRKNSYGEISIFDKNGKYIKSVHPRHVRVVAVPRDSQYIVRPPSMNTEQNLMVVLVGITNVTSLPMLSQVPPEFNDIDFMLSPRRSTWDISKHVTKKFHTADGQKSIVVFDDVFTQDELDQFLQKIDQGIYQLNLPNADSEDNVPWILGLELDRLIQSDLWGILSESLKVTTGTDTYYPYDVSCNNIQSWYQPKVHRDCLSNENDYTLLVYLTPNWNASLFGETVFFDDADEIITIVRPKFGRIVVFHGTIWHSARPPSPVFNGPRYTFAVKCAPTKKRAERKLLILSFESLFDFDEEMVGEERASEIYEFTTRLLRGDGEHEEMMELAEKYGKELEELENK